MALTQMIRPKEITCPFCGKGKVSLQTACEVCKSSFTHSYLAADPAAYRYIETLRQDLENDHAKQVEQQRKAEEEERLMRLKASSLSIGNGIVAVTSNTNQATWVGIDGHMHREEQVKQMLSSDSHTVILYTNGSLKAFGKNLDGQCEVSSYHDIVSIGVSADRTILVRKDGTVVALGDVDDVLRTELGKWNDVAQVSVENTHVSAITRDHGVRVAGYPAAIQEQLNNQAAKIFDAEEVQAGYGLGRFPAYTLVRRKNGTVVYIGDSEDPRSKVGDWQDIIAISAEKNYAVGLTKDGRLLVAGRKPRFSDILEEEAILQKTDICMLAPLQYGLGVIDKQMKLTITGAVPSKKTLSTLVLS